jgi:hypothetical protein
LKGKEVVLTDGRQRLVKGASLTVQMNHRPLAGRRLRSKRFGSGRVKVS